MATWPPFVDDDGTGTTGTVLDKAFFDLIKNYVDTKVSITPPTWYVHNAANFSADGSMTWTVSAAAMAQNWYMTIDKLLIWNVNIINGVIGGTPSAKLLLTFPPGVTMANAMGTLRLARALDGNGSIVEGFAFPENGKLAVCKEGFANWVTGSANTLWLTFLGFRN